MECFWEMESIKKGNHVQTFSTFRVEKGRSHLLGFANQGGLCASSESASEAGCSRTPSLARTTESSVTRANLDLTEYDIQNTTIDKSWRMILYLTASGLACERVSVVSVPQFQCGTRLQWKVTCLLAWVEKEITEK
jgi:hypothetical protein